MRQGNPDASYKKPDNVHQSTQATRATLFLHHLRTERPQAERTYLNSLQRKWNTYDGNHHCQARNKILDGSSKTTKQEPNNISQYLHRLFLFKCLCDKDKHSFAQHKILNDKKYLFLLDVNYSKNKKSQKRELLA